MSRWSDDASMLKEVKEKLFTAVVGDILDDLGYRHQFLPPEVRPLDPNMVLVGRAMTVLEADVFEVNDQPFGIMFEALDDLKQNEVYVVSGSSNRYAVWGELMATAALKRGGVGVVANGLIRDTRGLLEMGFPTFCRGSYAQDQRYRGRVIDYRVPIEIGAVRVKPGDIIFGDIDGVLVIPQEVEEEAIQRAFEKVDGENKVRDELARGMSAQEAFKRYGIM